MAGDQGAGGGLIVSLIAAVARNGVIGRSGEGMPWRLSSDLKRFKALTMGKPLIMGRKTFETLPGPLPGRRVIVVTRNAGWVREGVATARSLADALALAADAPEAMIGGGGEIYRLALPLASRVYLTEVDLAPEGDVRFPALDPNIWREVRRETGVGGPKDDADFGIVEYERG